MEQNTNQENEEERMDKIVGDKILHLFYDFMLSKGASTQDLDAAGSLCVIYMKHYYPGAWDKSYHQNAMLGTAFMSTLFGAYKTVNENITAEDKPKDGKIDLHSFGLGICFGIQFSDTLRGEVEKVHATILAAKRESGL